MAKATASFYEIINKSEDSKTVDLMIYGAIPSWDEDTWKMKNSAESFLKEFKALEKDFDRINIHINSPGGSLYHAFPIFNHILNSKKDVHTYNDGLAASAGGLLFLAGKKRHTAKNGILMIHNAIAWAVGNSDAIKEVAKTLDTYDNVIAKLFAERTGMTEQEVKEKYLNYKDHWLDADEAKEAGFVDEIEDYESEDAPPSNITEMAFNEVLNLYKERDTKSPSFLEKIVNHVKNAIRPGFDSSAPADDTTNGSKPNQSNAAVSVSTDGNSNSPTPSPIPTNTEDTMDFKNSLGILAKGQLTPEDVTAIKAEIEAFTGANEKFTAEEVTNQVTAATAPLTEQITNLTTEKTNLATQVTNLTNEKTALETEKSTLTTQVSNLTTDIQAYRASGVKPTQPAGAAPDKIDNSGDDSDSFLYSEADAEVANLRKQAGLQPRGNK